MHGRFKITPFQLVILSLVAGILFGAVLGEPAGQLEIVGDAYIRLLQMTVLPYILFSLMGGLGQLDIDMAKRIGRAGVGLILFLWLTAMLALLTMPLAYPEWTSATFFSTSLIEEPKGIDLLSLYIPSNPFYVLANTIVPAAVLFSIAMGLALITVRDKAGLIRGLHNLSDALMRIASFVARLAPVGIFALSAAAAGTLDLQALTKLQIYLWVYLAAWVVLTFVTLPLFVAWATPFGYREAMKDARTAMVTAFAAGTVLVVLPMIIERSKALLRQHGMASSEAETAIDVLVPTAYSFPSVGTLLGVGFILFAGWFAGSPLDLSQYPGFVVTGVISAFGTMAVALPFMLDYFHLPSDLFQLYLLGSVMTARFATVLAAMHAVVISLLGASLMLGRVRKRGLFRALGLSLALLVLVMWGLGQLLGRVVHYEYTGYKSFIAMQPMVRKVEQHLREELEPLSAADRDRPRLAVIRERGSLRVGFSRDSLPFAFRNEKGEVVGYDIDMLRQLASELGVGLELLRLDKEDVAPALAEGRIDIFAGGRAITAERALIWKFSRPYMSEHVAFLVPDYQRKRFSSLKSIRGKGHLRIGVPRDFADQFYGPLLKSYLPNAEIVPLASPREFFTGRQSLDALVYPAEAGSAWTLIYPRFSVVVPRGLRASLSLGLVLPHGQQEYTDFISLWIDVEGRIGMLDRLEKYWIYGQVEEAAQP